MNGDPSLRLWSDDPTLPPEKPTKPEGPEECILNVEATFESSTVDPEGESISYLFDWGDGTNSGWIGPYASGQIGNASHFWTELGEYEIKVMAKDNYGAQSEWSDSAIITIVENEPPGEPIITGPRSGPPNRLLKFDFVAEDPEGHDLYYKVFWGDGIYMPYDGPHASGKKVTFGYAWGEPDDYTIVVIVKDKYGEIGPQGSLKLKISKNRAATNPVLYTILERFIQHFSLFKMFSFILLNMN